MVRNLCEQAFDTPAPETPPGLPLLPVCGAALFDDRGRVLVCKRPEGKFLGGLWEFPGGKVESGESPEYALMRELREELGIEVRPCCFTPGGFVSHAYDEFHMILMLFICRIWRGVPQGLEGQEIRWAALTELSRLDMVPADLPLIPQLEAIVG